MSTLELNKIVGAVLTAGVIAMLSGFIAGIVYDREPIEEHAYSVTTGEGAEPVQAAAPAAAGIAPVAPLLGAANPAAGEKVAKKCTACHSLEQGGPNKIGPALWAVVNRPVAAAEGFSYSNALRERSGQVWSYENLNRFLAAPKDWASGTKMSFAGLKKVEDRADLIAHLRTLSDSPAPLPQAEATKPAAEAVQAAVPVAQAVVQRVAEAVTQAAETESGGELGAMIAAADAETGKKVARKCAACHSFDKGGANKIGPNLYNVVGRAVASHESFNYSSAFKGKSGETWTYANLAAFLTKPKDWVPGTKMSFAGLSKPEDRAAVLAYLREMNDAPPPLPK